MSFIMEIEDKDFSDIVETLADILGVKLEEIVAEKKGKYDMNEGANSIVGIVADAHREGFSEGVRCTEKALGWKSVEERLPEEYVRVLVSYQEGVCSAYYSFESWSSDPSGSFATDSIIFDVTHWMPLPKPPEVNDE